MSDIPTQDYEHFLSSGAYPSPSLPDGPPPPIPFPTHMHPNLDHGVPANYPPQYSSFYLSNGHALGHTPQRPHDANLGAIHTPSLNTPSDATPHLFDSLFDSGRAANTLYAPRGGHSQTHSQPFHPTMPTTLPFTNDSGTYSHHPPIHDLLSDPQSPYNSYTNSDFMAEYAPVASTSNQGWAEGPIHSGQAKRSRPPSARKRVMTGSTNQFITSTSRKNSSNPTALNLSTPVSPPVPTTASFIQTSHSPLLPLSEGAELYQSSTRHIPNHDSTPHLSREPGNWFAQESFHECAGLRNLYVEVIGSSWRVDGTQEPNWGSHAAEEIRPRLSKCPVGAKLAGRSIYLSFIRDDKCHFCEEPFTETNPPTEKKRPTKKKQFTERNESAPSKRSPEKKVQCLFCGEIKGLSRSLECIRTHMEHRAFRCTYDDCTVCRDKLQRDAFFAPERLADHIKRSKLVTCEDCRKTYRIDNNSRHKCAPDWSKIVPGRIK